MKSFRILFKNPYKIFNSIFRLAQFLVYATQIITPYPFGRVFLYGQFITFFCLFIIEA
jgi:hypothetical protein